MPVCRIKSELILKLRVDEGWTQEEAAHEAKIDVRTWRKYERPRWASTSSVLQMEVLRRIADFLRLPSPMALLDQAPPGEMAQRSKGDADVTYVHRVREEQIALRVLQGQRSPIILHGGRGMGKATLTAYLLDVHTERRPDLCCARVHFTRFSEAEIAHEATFFRRVAQCLSQELSLLDPASAAPQGAQAVETPQQLSLFVRELLEHRPLLLSFENAERLHGRSYQNVFFRLLRGWVDARAPRFNRLQLLVSLEAEPLELESPEHSPFCGVARSIAVQPFNAAQLDALLEQQGLSGDARARALLGERLGGVPHLCVSAIERALEESYEDRDVSPGQILAQPGFLVGAFAAHLQDLTRWLQQEGLLPAIARLLRDASAPMIEDEYSRLHGRGVVHRVPGQGCQFTSALYAEHCRALI